MRDKEFADTAHTRPFDARAIITAARLAQAGAYSCACGKPATRTQRFADTGTRHRCATCAENDYQNRRLDSLKAERRRLSRR